MTTKTKLITTALAVLLATTLTACGAKPDAASDPTDIGADTSVDTNDTAEDHDTDGTDTSDDGTDADAGDDVDDDTDDSGTAVPVRDIAAEIEALTANAGTPDEILSQCAPHSRADGMEWSIGDDWARNQYTGRWGVQDMTLGYDCLARVTGMPDDVRQQIMDTDGQWKAADWDGHTVYWDISGQDADIIVTD